MQDARDRKKTDEIGTDLVGVPPSENLNWRIHGRSADDRQPINLCIVVNSGSNGGNQWGFTFHRSRLFWFALMIALSVLTTYARVNFVCRSFKNEGRFYYGMNLDRCVGTLMQEPLASFERHLEKLNASY